MQFDYIVAVDQNWGIAKNNTLPWRNTDAGREDMSWFKIMTSEPGTAVIMGRKTWQSINCKPLQNRVNIVVSSAHEDSEAGIPSALQQVVKVSSFRKALNWCENSAVENSPIRRCFVIGGRMLYEEAMQSQHLRYGYITKIDGDFACDVEFPYKFVKDIQCEEINTPGKSLNKYYKYDFSNIDEEQYRGLCRKLLSAPARKNRTETPTRGVFHEVLKFQLYENGRGRILPLITSKFTSWRSIYHELIWFLRASTNTDYLCENNVHIWDGNSTREFLDSRGLEHYEEGEVGAVYGYQWRSWGKAYWHKTSKYRDEITFEGIDQLAQVIETLKTDPWSRRMVVSAWNVEHLPDMVLPPCHYAFQFHVDPDKDGAPKYLNCIVNMRSADVALGVPFNIASYAFLTHIVSYLTGLLPGTLSVSMADCHLYENHVDGVIRMLQRMPRRFPTLMFKPVITQTNPTIDDFAYKFTIDDYIVVNYEPHPFIKLQMAA